MENNFEAKTGRVEVKGVANGCKIYVGKRESGKLRKNETCERKLGRNTMKTSFILIRDPLLN